MSTISLDELRAVKNPIGYRCVVMTDIGTRLACIFNSAINGEKFVSDVCLNSYATDVCVLFRLGLSYFVYYYGDTLAYEIPRSQFKHWKEGL